MKPIPFELDEVTTTDLRGGVRAVLNDEGTRWGRWPVPPEAPALPLTEPEHGLRRGRACRGDFSRLLPWEPERTAHAAAEAFEGEIVDIQVPPTVLRELNREPPPGAVY
jgi:hypothetical protein